MHLPWGRRGRRRLRRGGKETKGERGVCEGTWEVQWGDAGEREAWERDVRASLAIYLRVVALFSIALVFEDFGKQLRAGVEDIYVELVGGGDKDGAEIDGRAGVDGVDEKLHVFLSF
jgi:hypothetical protein